MLRLICTVCLTLGLLASHAPADPIAQRRAAMDLVKQGHDAQALDAFIKLAAEVQSDAHKTDALEQAAMAARRLEQFDRAIELARQIPDPPRRGMVQMRLLIESAQHQALLEQFGAESLDTWPGATAGEAAYYRAQAHARAGNGAAAEADCQLALSRLPAGMLRSQAALAQADNYRDRLHDSEKAIAAYEALQAQEQKRQAYGWILYRSTISAAHLLRTQQKLDAAQAVMQRVELPTHAYWRAEYLLARARIQADQGDRAAASATLQQALAIDGILAVQKEAAEKHLAQLQTP